MPVYSVSRRRAIALLALTSILLITLDMQGNSVVRGLRGVFSAIFEPVQSSARVITRPLENSWRGITHYGELEAENQRLQDQLDQQEGAFIAALATARDAQELLALNGIDNLADISSVTAQVIGGTPSNYSQTIEINQGSDRGLRVGMPVVNAAGLVGRITWVDNDRSLVLLANDSLYAIPVQVVNQPNLVPATTTTTTTTTSTTTTSTTTTTSSTTTTLPLRQLLGPSSRSLPGLLPEVPRRPSISSIFLLPKPGSFVVVELTIRQLLSSSTKTLGLEKSKLVRWCLHRVVRRVWRHEELWSDVSSRLLNVLVPLVRYSKCV